MCSPTHPSARGEARVPPPPLPTRAHADAAGLPGAVVVWERHAPAFRVLPLDRVRGLRTAANAVLDLGEQDAAGATVILRWMQDGWSIWHRSADGDVWVDGDQVPPGASRRAPARAVLTVDRTLALLDPDVRPHLEHGLRVEDGRVIGPLTAAAELLVAGAAQRRANLLILVETGAETALLGSLYHRHLRGSSGRYAALDCVGLDPEELEVRLFGAVRGAVTPAAVPRRGLFRAADGGTLFLDGMAELPLGLQAEIRRAVDRGQYRVLGESRDRPFDVRVVGTAHPKSLVHHPPGTFPGVVDPRFAECTVRLPPLRERREEIPWQLVSSVARVFSKLDEAQRPLHHGFVRACMLRSWRWSNDLGLANAAGGAAMDVCGDRASVVRADHLQDLFGEDAVPLRVHRVEACAAREELQLQLGLVGTRALGISRGMRNRRLRAR